MTALIVALAAAAAATTATAQPSDRLSDGDFLQAARCAGLASADSLGAVDTKAIDALMKEQSRGRANLIYGRAETLRTDAFYAARHARGPAKEKLIAERDGVCKRFLG